MRNNTLLVVCSFILTSAAFAGVNVSAPSGGTSLGSPVHFSATAGSTSCSKGVASMGIYTTEGNLAYVVNGTSIDTDLTLEAGSYNSTIQQWDYCGGSSSAKVSYSVASGNSSGVTVTEPANKSTVGSPVTFKATATTSCSKGVASMGIYTSPGVKTYVVSGASLNTSLNLSPGTYNTTVEEWDNCGGATTTPVTITVSSSGGSGGGGTTLSNLQASGGWTGFGELPPNYPICSKCGSGVTWSMKQGIKSPSMSGDAAEYTIGGDEPYSDVLWNNHLIGPGSTQGLPDPHNTLIASLHNFTYDIYFYGTDLSLSENIEFDLGQFFDNTGWLFGVQCQIVNGSQWALWNNTGNRWDPIGIPCKPTSNTWNHMTVTFEKDSSNNLLYQTITLNGVTNNINASYPPYSTPGWDGLVVNFQLDGNYKQEGYNVYVDDFSVTYQ